MYWYGTKGKKEKRKKGKKKSSIVRSREGCEKDHNIIIIKEGEHMETQ